MLNLLKYLKTCKKEAIIAPLFKLIEAFFELLVPFVILRIIDFGIEKSDKIYIYKMSFLLLLFAIIGFICSLIAQYYSAKAGVFFASSLREDLFKHILSLSNKELDELGKNSLINKMTNDTNQLQTGLNMFFRLVLRSPFIVFGALILISFIDFKLSLSLFVIIFLLYLSIFFIMKYNIFIYKLIQEKLDLIFRITRENLLGIRFIRIFNKSKKEEEEFILANENLYSSQKKLSHSSSLLNFSTYFMLNLSIVFILFQASFKINMGTLTKGEVAAIINYIFQILAELLKSANLFFIISKSLASAKRIDELFKKKNSILENTYNEEIIRENENILEFKNVYFSYEEGQGNILEDINFSLKKGENLGIIGSIASGKSTLINLILRLYEVDKGEILFKSKNIKSYSLIDLRSKISLVEQKATFFKGSIFSNLELVKNEFSNEKLEEALKLSLSENILDEKGLMKEIEYKGKNFSGGQKQRLSILRALLKDFELLILDDSTSALDFLSDKKFRENIKSINKTIIMISQRIVSIKDFDKILVLDNGKIESIGKHEDLLNISPIYREIYESQFE